MKVASTNDDIESLAEKLNFAEKVERSLQLIERAYEEHGSRLVIADSMGKDSSVVWDLAQRVIPEPRGFVVTTRFKPLVTKRFMEDKVEQHLGRLRVYENTAEIPKQLHRTDPDRCCELLKLEPTRQAIREMDVACWVTGLRCTEGRTRTDFREIEERDEGLVKLNPILLWYEREVWQYLALYRVSVNPLYKRGYRSLGCEPCTRIVAGTDERGGRWAGTSKCGGECGIHTRPLADRSVV
jgi:phosphoadenosine phosphosulfate reductase